MKNDNRTVAGRRDFLRTGIALALTAGAIGASRRTLAADLPALDPADPTAQALGYVADAAAGVDTAKWPKYAAGQSCATCQLYQGGAAASGPCGIFPGKGVAAAGWCNAYIPKA